VKLARSRGARRRAAAVAIAVSSSALLSGCGLFGPGTEVAAPSVMTVSSGEFVGGVMPVQFTCAWGRVETPPLSWAGSPPGTKSLALVMDDSAAPITPFVYWIVFDINFQTSEIMEGRLPQGARQARNSAGSIGYHAPCPGASGHTYRFTVYALDRVLHLPEGTSLQSAWRAIAAAAIGRGRVAASAES
jgi:Raf kinase inhibitor-like YbhB/YbcL family protein